MCQPLLNFRVHLILDVGKACLSTDICLQRGQMRGRETNGDRKENDPALIGNKRPPKKLKMKINKISYDANTVTVSVKALLQKTVGKREMEK